MFGDEIDVYDILRAVEDGATVAIYYKGRLARLALDEPYEKLQRALRAEIDEVVWSTLYSTKSYPFDRPASGKIAVKVINHYGDEVLKVYAV